MRRHHERLAAKKGCSVLDVLSVFEVVVPSLTVTAARYSSRVRLAPFLVKRDLEENRKELLVLGPRKLSSRCGTLLVGSFC